jgi:hypothetical protein
MESPASRYFVMVLGNSIVFYHFFSLENLRSPLATDTNMQIYKLTNAFGMLADRFL